MALLSQKPHNGNFAAFFACIWWWIKYYLVFKTICRDCARRAGGHFAKHTLHFAIYYYTCSRYTPIIPHFAVKTHHMRARSSNATHTHVYAYARVLVRAYAHARIRYRANLFTFYNVFCKILLVYCLCCVNTVSPLTYTVSPYTIGIVKRDTAHGQRHAWEVTRDSCTGPTPCDTYPRHAERVIFKHRLREKAIFRRCFPYRQKSFPISRRDGAREFQKLEKSIVQCHYMTHVSL